MPADDPVSQRGDLPANDAFAITPHDTNDLAQTTRGIYIGGAGAVAVITQAGTTVTFSGAAAGSVIPVSVSRVLSTGTTATNLVGLV